MAFETIGDYQLHMMAYELPGSRGWDPFITILKFDDATQDFRCVLEKHHASEVALPSYQDAIDEARRVGNRLIDSGAL